METVACPICSGTEFASTPGYAKDPVVNRLTSERRSRWAICQGCGLVLQNPRPSADDLEQLYRRHEYHQRGGADITAALAYGVRRPEPLIKYIDEHYAPSSDAPSVLDVGCGLGGALISYRLRGWDVHGVEPDPYFAEVAQGLGVPVEQRFFDGRSFRDLRVDLVFTCHAFEHFLYPLDIAASAREKLKPDGRLFICVPTYRKPRTWAREWMNVSHTFIFTHATLGNLLFRAGFDVTDYRYHSSASELWLLARPAEKAAPAAPLPYREDWRAVKRELEVTVPLRAATWALPRVAARNVQYVPQLLLDPQEFRKGFGRRLSRRRGKTRVPASTP